LICTGVVCFGILGCVAYTGPLPQNIFGHDLFALLDGGWRWQWGIVPHADYYSPMGALSYLLVFLGISASGSLADALPTAVWLFGLCLLPFLLYVTFTRMVPLVAALACVAVLAAAVAPHQLRFGSEAWSYAGIYNRWGYALLSLALLTIAVTPFNQTIWKEIGDGGITGACIALLVCLKISYGCVAIAVFGVCTIINRRSLKFYIASVVAMATWAVVFGFLIHWAFVSFSHDMLLAFRARDGLGLGAVFHSMTFLYDPLFKMVLLVGLSYLSASIFLGAAATSRLLKGLQWGSCCAICAIIILMTNSPLGSLPESPVLVLGALLLGSWIVEDGANKAVVGAPSHSSVRSTITLITGLVVLSLLVPVTGRNLAGLLRAAAFKHRGKHLAANEMFQTGPLRGIQILGYGGDPPLPTSYIGKLQDGLDLLRETGNLNTPVITFDFTNPFNVARGVRPCRGGPPAWQLGFLYSAKVAPRIEQVFDGATGVMVPKQFGDGNQANLEVLMQHYGFYLQEHFRAAGESPQWQLFVPKSAILAPEGVPSR